MSLMVGYKRLSHLGGLGLIPIEFIWEAMICCCLMSFVCKKVVTTN